MFRFLSSTPGSRMSTTSSAERSVASRSRRLVGRLVVLAVAAGLMAPVANPSSALAAEVVCDRLVWEGKVGAEKEILVADADGTNREVVSDGGLIPPTGSKDPVWSPDGTRLAWSGDALLIGLHIWVADADGGNRINASSAGTGIDPKGNNRPQWSPDGSRIAWYGRDTDGVTNQIWVADADGADRLMISDVGQSADPFSNRHPQWSPDGSRIAWSGVDTDGFYYQVWVADADGNDRLMISDVGQGTDPTDNYSPVWRPRVGVVSLQSSVSGPLVAGEPVQASITASAGACPMGSIVIDGVDLACVDVTSRTATAGVVSDSGVWSMASLEGTQTATISGVVTGSGDCSSTATVTQASPALGTPASTTFGHPACDTSPTPFTDVAASSFAFDDVVCIYRLDITTGTSPTTYGPGGYVTREQMAAFLARLWRAATATGLHV